MRGNTAGNSPICVPARSCPHAQADRSATPPAAPTAPAAAKSCWSPAAAPDAPAPPPSAATSAAWYSTVSSRPLLPPDRPPASTVSRSSGSRPPPRPPPKSSRAPAKTKAASYSLQPPCDAAATERLGQLLLGFATCAWRRRDHLAVAVVRSIIVSVRLARLPSPFAKSLL